MDSNFILYTKSSSGENPLNPADSLRDLYPEAFTSSASCILQKSKMNENLEQKTAYSRFSLRILV